MIENIKPPQQEKMTVSFRHYWRWKFAIEEGRWICYAPWMPQGKDVTIDIPVDHFRMMQKEQDEGDPVTGAEPYHNARRYYRMLVVQELNKKAKEADNENQKD
jgi:hypothetical protein